jgi:hypothetical protein
MGIHRAKSRQVNTKPTAQINKIREQDEQKSNSQEIHGIYEQKNK